MRYLTLAEVIELHCRVIEQSGGSEGIRDFGGVESAIAQPQTAFEGQELYRPSSPKLRHSVSRS